MFVLFFVFFNLMDNDHGLNMLPVASKPGSGKGPAGQMLAPGPGKEGHADKPDMPLIISKPASDKAPAGQLSLSIAGKDQESPAASEMHRYYFSAADKSVWLQIFDASRQLLREVLLQPGDHLRLSSDSSALFVTCGNAAALEIDIDDKTIAAAGSLGEAGEVLHDYRLEPPGHGLQ